MDLKKTIGRVTKDKILSEVSSKILPMEAEPKKLGWKAKAAAGLATIAAIAGMLSQYLNG
jgi:hypothetical protein